jgi:titin
LPPASPGNLTAQAVSCSQINLAWQDNSDNEDLFRIERSENGTTFAEIDTVGPNVTSYSDTGLDESTTYWYRVRACNAAGCSGYSNVASATTPACQGLPSPPYDLVGKQTGNNEITLKWKHDSVISTSISETPSTLRAFIVYRGTLSITSISAYADLLKPIAKVPPNQTWYVDQDVEPEKVYYYKVCAVNSYGESCSEVIRVNTE